MNTFGNSSSQQYPLYDPREVRHARERFRRDAIPALDRANSLYAPAGRWPARGWILVAQHDYSRIDTWSTSLQLEIGDSRQPDNVGALKGLAVVQAQCVTRGLATDPNALYLVELTDARGVLANRWFSLPTTSQYNLRAPAYPGEFHTGSLNGGVVWTWETMIRDLWQQMGARLGAWPGLPYVPAGVPEGFRFVGVPAWQALCDVLDHLGMTVAVDLTKADPYTIVSMGAADAAFTVLQAKYTTHLEDDLEWIDAGAGRVPATVRVFFKRREGVYGTEETVRRDSLQWSTTPLYSVSVAAPAIFTGAVGTHHLWSDFTVRYDVDGAPLAADVATATAIAQERTTQYFDLIYSRTSGFMSRTYAGALPLVTGSQVDGVCWQQDLRGDRWAGWRTTIVRGQQPPFADVYG